MSCHPRVGFLHAVNYNFTRESMQSRGLAGSHTAASYVSSRRHHSQSMAFRGPLSLLWLALSVGTGPAACFVVLPSSNRVAAASPLPKIVLGSRQGGHGVGRSRSEASVSHGKRRLFGFAGRFEQQERAGEEGQTGQERRAGDGEAATTGVGSAPAAQHAMATGIRKAKELIAAAGLSGGKGFGFTEAAARKASALGEAEEDAATTGVVSGAPATDHSTGGASIRSVKALLAMAGLSRRKGSRATATALKASATGADVAPPTTSATSRPKKILIIMSDTGGGHRASSQALSAALENLYGDQVRMGMAQRWGLINLHCHCAEAGVTTLLCVFVAAQPLPAYVSSLNIIQ